MDKEKRFKITYWSMMIIIIFLTTTLVNKVNENCCIVDIGENTYIIEAHGDVIFIEYENISYIGTLDTEGTISIRAYEPEREKVSLLDGESQEICGMSFSIRKEGTFDITWRITIVTQKGEVIVLKID